MAAKVPVGCRWVVVVVVVVVGVCAPPATAMTTPQPSPPPPPPLSPLSTTAGVMTEPPPPRPVDLRMRPKDCPLYVLGELKAIKKHGESWFNDGNACEPCTCVEGQKRCYYHYCNVGSTEVVTNPPAGRPPLDDEDGGEDEGEEEGSGRPPPPPLDTFLKEYRKGGPSEWRTGAGDNDTRPPAFCVPFCPKICPWGYKIDPLRQCRQCSCRRQCKDVEKCHLRCPEGLATDSNGCHVCLCRGEGHGGHHGGKNSDPACNETTVRGCVDGPRTRRVGESWSRGPCVACACVADGYTECNVTQCPFPAPPCRSHAHNHHHHHALCCPPCQESPAPLSAASEDVQEVSVGRAEVSVESAWERQVTYAQPHGEATGDGAVKSAVQATGVQWWQVWVVMVPLTVLCVLAAACALKYRRRTHSDKYDINTYRPSPLTEKLRPVTTVDDQMKGRMM